jgi:hypothetical protein
VNEWLSWPFGLLFHERDGAGCNGHSGVVTADVTRKETSRHRRDLQENESRDEAQNEKRRHGRCELSRAIEIHRAARFLTE